MTTIAIPMSAEVLPQTFIILVSEVTEFFRTAIETTQQQMSFVVTTIAKTSGARIVAVRSEKTRHKPTVAHAIWRYRSAAIVGLVGIGSVAPMIHADPITGLILPIALWLWWLRYKELERSD
jgi:hypothetical protein